MNNTVAAILMTALSISAVPELVDKALKHLEFFSNAQTSAMALADEFYAARGRYVHIENFKPSALRIKHDIPNSR